MIQTLNFNAIRTKIKGAAAAVIFLLTVMPGYGQQKLTRQEYIDRYKETAMEAMRTHGIPASITLAQGCHRHTTKRTTTRGDPASANTATPPSPSRTTPTSYATGTATHSCLIWK